MQTPQFVKIPTKDGLTLPGLLYPSNKSKAIAIFLHGNGSSSVFYNEEINQIYAKTLNEKGVSMLYFNNRGAHYIKSFYIGKGKEKTKKRYGMAYEKIKETILDIDGAISSLKKLGYKKFYLIGASTGANKICVYSYYKPKNDISKYVLLCGGDDTGIYYNELGRNKFKKLIKISKNKIKTKHGDDIIPELLPNIFSYTGFYDIANPDGDYNTFPFYEAISHIKLSKSPLFRYFKSIKKPSLVVYGEMDEYIYGDASRVVEILKNHQPQLDYKIIKGADHGFKYHEKELAKIIAGWIV